jgi:hypothetical protein
MAGCAHVEQGWSLEDSRTCPHAQQMRVCVKSEPDRGLVARVGDAELVPGECASREGEERRGRVSLRVEAEDGAVQQETLRARSGQLTTVLLAGSGSSVERQACEAGALLSSQ